jgi:hypothetical protein
MLPSRTAKYVEALIREGDSFDYRTWLQQVRYEEAEVKQTPAAFSSGEFVGPEIGNLTIAPDCRNAWASSGSAPQAKSATIPRAVYKSEYRASGESPKDRLRRKLMKVSDAWDDFQESRARDAVYKYLAAVFEVVVHHKGQRRTKRLLRRAFQFAGLSFDKNADPFATVIRCTSERNVDNKTISKWARALRYASHCKKPRTRLKTFMKEMTGVNGCADRFTRYFGRGSQ